MPITVTCPSCQQMCAVEEQYAGMMVQCPKCQNIIQVPRPDAAAGAVAAQQVAAGVPPTPPPPPPVPGAPAPAPGPAAPAGPGLMDTIQTSATAFGLDKLGLLLVYIGLGCMAGMVLFTILPWASAFGASVLGISTGIGAFNFLLTIGAAAFMIVVFLVVKQPKMFDISLWVVVGWCGLALLWRLANIVSAGSFAGVGLYLTMLANLGAAGCFGFLTFQRLTKKKV